mgnify:CR=1 FL=1
MIRTIFYSSALVSLLSPALAHADDAPGAAAETDILVLGTRPADADMPSQTGSRLGLTILDTPASVETLSGDIIVTVAAVMSDPDGGVTGLPSVAR